MMRLNNGNNKHAGGCYGLNLVIKYRLVVLAVLILLTGFLCFQLKNFKMATDDPLAPMYQANHEFLPALKAIKNMAPQPRMLVCIVEVKKGDIYNTDTIKKIKSITNVLLGTEGIIPSSVTSLTRGVQYFNNTAEGLNIEPILGNRMPETEKEFQTLKRKVAVSPMGPGKYVSYDGTAVMISALLGDIEQSAKKSYNELSDIEQAALPFEKHKAKVDNDFNRNLVKNIMAIKAKEDDDNHTVYFMGEQVLKAQLNEIGRKHIGVAAGMMFAVIIVLLAVYFRTYQGVLFPFISMLLSLLWGMGLLAMAGIEFNPMALLFPLILGLIALSLSALTLKQYYDFLNDGNDKNTAIIKAYCSPLINSSLIVLGVVMIVMAAASLPIIKQLGFLGLFWLVGVFAIVCLLNPILAAFFPQPIQTKIEGRFSMAQSLSEIPVKLFFGNGKYIVFAIMIVVIAYGSLGFHKIRIGNNIPGTSYIRSDHPWNQCFNLLAKKFMGPYQLLVYVKANEKGGILDPDVMDAITDFSDFLKKECGARDCIAFDYMVQMARMTMMDGSPKWQIVPDSREKIKGLAGMIVERGNVDTFIDKTYTEATISPFFPEKDASAINRYASLMKDYITNNPSDKVVFCHGGGLLGMTKLINDSTTAAYPRVIIISFICIFILSVLITRSVLKGIIITLPVVAAQTFVWTIMNLADIPISMAFVPAVPPALGLGAAFCLILMHAFTDQLVSNNQYESGIQNGMKKSGGLVIFMGGLVFAASLPWFFIGMKFQSDMMLMFGITVFFEILISIVLIPVAVYLLKPKFRRRQPTM